MAQRVDIRSVPLDRTRNLGIIAHVDAGNTSLAERILFVTGRVHRAGEIGATGPPSWTTSRSSSGTASP